MLERANTRRFSFTHLLLVHLVHLAFYLWKKVHHPPLLALVHPGAPWCTSGGPL